jgi:hypothetical protein
MPILSLLKSAGFDPELSRLHFLASFPPLRFSSSLHWRRSIKSACRDGHQAMAVDARRLLAEMRERWRACGDLDQAHKRTAWQPAPVDG